jgi:TnpA family transposase
MQSWQGSHVGVREVPREVGEFELQAFFTFSRAEHAIIQRRRSSALKLGLALHIGFVRMSGRPLDAFRVLPVALLRHLGKELDIPVPDVASLRALYARGRTLSDHQQLACRAVGFGWMTQHQRRALLRALKDEASRCSDRERLLVHARRWLYEHQVLIVHDRALRRLVSSALTEFEAETATSIRNALAPEMWQRWLAATNETRPDGQTMQNWLWSAPAKHSTRQIAEVLERVELLVELGVDRVLLDLDAVLVRRFARRLAWRAPSASVKIKEPARTVEVACFLRHCLLTATDQLILMVQRRVVDLWRQCADALPASEDLAARYRALLGELAQLSADGAVPDSEFRSRVAELVLSQRNRRPSRASLIRERLMDTIRPVRSLIAAIIELPWQAKGEHPVVQALLQLHSLYAAGERSLPAAKTESAAGFGRVWSAEICSVDREWAFRALEVATLFAWRRAVRNGSVWLEHSLSFRGRDRLFLPPERWQAEAPGHYARLSLPTRAADFLAPLLERIRAGVDAVAEAARAGTLRVDDELHLSPLPADEESPEVSTLRDELDDQIGEVQLPEAILEVDAQVRFSWIMLGHEPRSVAELLMAYAGILAHGTSLTAAECARMIPQLSATSVRQAMRWAGDERRLRLACQAVLEHMQSHPIAASWGRADLASSDMMSLETSRRVWQARVDPRRQTASIGIYSHVRDRWGIFHAQPIVLNERQAGAALEGVVRQERVETAQLAVDTHGYTDFAMALARLLGFDLCPRLRELAQRRLFLPRGSVVPEALAKICSAHVETTAIDTHWDSLVNLAASVSSGHVSAVTVLARLGSAARGDPLYDAGVQLGKLLRTAFLTDYFINEAFRRELRRVLNRGEAVNALKRAIYSGRVHPLQARRGDEMQAVADALSLLANILMAWNTSRMQAALDRWSSRRRSVPPALIGRIAPTRLEGINLRGVFRFPVERYVEQLLPSQTALKTRAAR